jgi:cation-transporting ATPase I
MPLHAAGAAADTGFALATMPVRGVAALVSGLAEIQSPARVAVELVGGPRARRCWHGHGRAWIEVRGLHDPTHGPALADRVLSALRAQPDVASAELNYPLSRVVVSLSDADTPVGELCDLVAEAESSGATDETPVDLPGDGEALASRLVALTASSLGLCAALAGRAVPWARIPAGITAPVAILDYQPRLRHLLESRFGTTATDTVLAVATASVYTAAQAWTSLAVDMLLHLAKAAESRAEQRVWTEREPSLAMHARSDDSFIAPRPCPLPPGPVEKHGDRSALVQAVGVAGLAALTGNPNFAATAAVVAAPKAARIAREAFASTLTRGLSENHSALLLRAEALRRLDRVDAVLIDPRALSLDELRVSRILGALDQDRAAIWQWAHAQLEEGALHSGWNRVAGSWSTNGDGRSNVRALVRPAHHPLASAVIGEARRSGAVVMSLDLDELDDLRSTFDDLAPMSGSVDAALADAVIALQRDGRTVLVVGTAAAGHALSAADVGVGVRADDDERLPWCADLFVDDLAGAWRILHALPAAAKASQRGVDLSTAASLLGALLMVPGVRGRGPGPVTAGAAAGLWTGFSLARKVIGAAAPTPAAIHEWHAMSAEQVQRFLPTNDEHGLPQRTRTRASSAGRMVSSARQAVGEFVTTLREEASDPLTPVLAIGSAASAVLGSPADAVLVGSVLAFNSALAATQQVRAQRLLRRLLAVQAPSARKVCAGGNGSRYVDVEAAALRQGDVIEVRPGEVIPADARLIEVADLEVDESTLTGESLPVPKQLDSTPGAVLAERSCMLFATTTVVAGTGVAVVTAVGPQTEARRAAEVPSSERVPVGLQAQLRELTDRALPVSLAGGALVSALALVRRASLRPAVASGVAVTIAAVPEGLSLVATLAQQASARRLTKLGALVRTPRSVEALGRVDVVCFDKTGTLSENRLRVARVYAAHGRSRDDVLGCAASAAACADDGGRHAHATDAAIIAAAAVSIPSESAAHLPFRSGRLFSATLVGARLTVKGAPEVVLDACADAGASVRRAVRDMAREGLRVIATAETDLTQEQVWAARENPEAFAELCRDGLCFTGLLGLSDTPRAEAAGILAALAAQDVDVRLITGDHPITAAAIANELGLSVTADQVISGSQWEAMPRRSQEQAVADGLVFARMSPENKVQVVQTLERTGKICAMVGDGANDAAAIRAATVGIGVAAHGSDPARTAADVMLLDGRIGGLLDALDEGRKLWLRVQAAVCVLLGGNAGEVVFAIIGSAVTGRSPLNTRQLLLVNMLTDALPAAALAVSEPNSDIPTTGRGLDQTALWRTIGVRGATTAGGATLAWALASLTGRPRRASTVGLVALVATQLGQTLLDSRSRLVVLTAVGSLAAMAAIVSTPGVSQLLGNTPLGPIGWAQALGSAFAATLTAAAMSTLLSQRETSAAGRPPISTIPARHNTAYSSRNGMANAPATTSVNGSELTPEKRFDTASTVTET